MKTKNCPNCGAYDLSCLAGSDGYIYHSICLVCGYELTLEERKEIKKGKTKQ